VIDTPTPSTTLVRPVNPSLHADYTFYLRTFITGGGDTTFFGPWELSVGCTEKSVSITDHPSLSIEGAEILVGDSPNGFYSFVAPLINRDYCTAQLNEAVEIDGSTPHSMVTCSSQPCTSFDLVSTDEARTILFKIKTTATNGIEHLSPEIS
jgi:hypothetical protein